MATLQGRAIKDTFKDLLQVSNSNNGVDGTTRTVEDGEGTQSALQVSTGAVKVNGDFEVTGNVVGVPHVDYKDTYVAATAYLKDDVVNYNGSSYIAKVDTTGNAPTNTLYWGLLASKGTDGVDGTNGTNGATGPAGADGTDVDWANLTDSIVIRNSVPQLYLSDSDSASTELGNLAVIACNTNAFRVALGNDSVSRLTLTAFNHPSDNTDTIIYSGLQLNSGLVMGTQRSSALTDTYLPSTNTGLFYLDDGLSWNFRATEVANYHRMLLSNEGSGGTIGTNGAGGVQFQAEQKLDGCNAEFQGKRSVGTHNGTNYSVTNDFPRDQMSAQQGNIQAQASVGRLSFNYMYKVGDTTKWYNTSTASTPLTGLTGGSELGAISQFYLYGEGLASASNKRSLTPAGNNMDLGMSSAQWRDVFSQNAPTVSSDRNLKQDIEAISESEKSVAIALKGMVKKYRLKSSVEKKGDEARVHIGWIAQEVEDAFTAQGLDASDYALFCKDTHYKVVINGNDTGESQRTNKVIEDDIVREGLGEGDVVEFQEFEQYSLRYEQLHSFIISVL